MAEPQRDNPFPAAAAGSPLPSAGALGLCAAANLRQAARAVTQHFDKALVPSGLRITQFTVLSAIAKAEGPLPLTQLAEQLVMDRTTLSRNLQPLKASGYLRHVSGGDRRIRAVLLTEAGEAALRKALPLWAQAQMEMLDTLGATRWKAARMMFSDLVAHCRGDGEQDANASGTPGQETAEIRRAS